MSSPGQKGVVVAMLWRVLMGMPSAHVVGTKARGKTHVWRRHRLSESSALF